MFKTFALSFIFMGLTLQACGQGCLKCNAQSTCIVCDISTFYSLSNGSCVLNTANNCGIIKMNGDCFACNSGYYIDSNTKKCVAVLATKVVAQCNAYDGSQNCVACNTGFYVSSANCTAVNTTVANCNLYTANGVCGACATGYIFSVDGTACVATPTIANCGSYTYLACNSCGSGFVNNANNYFSAFNTSAGTTFENLFLNSFRQNTNWRSLSVCQAIAVTNCASYKSFNQCAVCSAGYFLNAVGTCTAFPLAIIEGCAMYGSATTCVMCTATKRLIDSAGTGCVDNTPVTNCLTYNPAAVGATICVGCTANYYLQSGTCSTIRVNSLNVQNCATTATSADQCATCITGFRVTSDGAKCLTAISNCATYGQTSSSSTVQTCTACNNGFYLSTDNASCIAGTIANCLVYSNASTCTTCDALSFLSGTTCTRHQAISNCSTYSGSTQNTCTSCNAGFYPLALTQTCAAATSIPNCDTFTFNVNGALGCTNCKSGFYLNPSSTCTMIPAAQIGCVAYDGTNSVCTICNFGYLLTYNGKCALPFQFLTQNCQVFTDGTASTSLKLFDDVTAANAGSCATCRTGSVPFSYVDTYACVEYAQIANIFGANTAITNCARFMDVATVLTCAECRDGYINVAGVCTVYVSSTTVPCSTASNYLLIDDIRNGVVNKCVTGTGAGVFANCKVAARFDLTAGAGVTTPATIEADYACIQPTNTYGFFLTDLFTAATVNIPYTTVTPVYDSSSGSAVAKYATTATPVLLFKRYNDITVTALSTNAVANCEAYMTVSSAVKCVKCNPGFSVVITAAGATSCAAITGCDSTVTMGGLSSVVTKLLSCHSCSGATLPTITMTTDTSGPSTTRVWSFINPSATINTNTCAAAPAGTIANCAVIGVDFTQTSNYCLACKPGYVAAYATASATVQAIQITTCTAITNCAASGNTAFNACTNCGVDASNNQYAATDITFQACSQVTTANCMIKGTGVCDLCKPGYFLNYNNVCERLVLPFCSDAVQSKAITFTSTVADYPKLMTYYTALRSAGSFESGCRRCTGNQGSDSNSYIGFKFAAATPITGCVQSTYATTVAVTATTLGYIANCQQYSNTAPAAGALLTCVVCNSGYIPKANGSGCVAATISNCITVDSTTTTTCTICATNYILVNGQCVAKTISNCNTYAGGSSLTCTACNAGYYLGTGSTSCVMGSVLNCSAYTAQSATSCTACLTGFTLVTSANSGSYCMPVNTAYNCLTMDSGSGSGVGLLYKQYVCTSCATSDTTSYNLVSYTATATTPATICASLNSVANCATYSAVPASSFAANTFACATCASGFYLSATGFACIARTKISSNCATYANSADVCSVCNNFSFLSADSTTCITFPNGILGCSTYSNSTVCTACNAPRYLSNNTCLVSPVVTNCATYSANNTCSGCNAGFFLTNSTSCQPATAQNCLTYQSISACATCGANMGLQTTGSVTNCVSNAVSNCMTATTISPFTCLQCNTGYYVNGQSGCSGVSTVIANCNLYDSATTCLTCLTGFALASNKTACTNSYLLSSDANCAITNVLATPTCSQCALGSYFVNGTCTTCSNNTASSGCLTCDPNNQSTCFACMSGYYQQASGSCVRISGQTTGNNNNGTNTIPTSSASITSVLGLLVLLFVSLF